MKAPAKCFLFHLEYFFRSQVIYVFVLTLWSYRKNGLIRNIRVFLKFMLSQAGKQTVTIYILSNISRSKDNHTMKFGQLIE